MRALTSGLTFTLHLLSMTAVATAGEPNSSVAVKAPPNRIPVMIRAMSKRTAQNSMISDSLSLSRASIWAT